MRATRIEESDPLLDKLEMDWWNQNAQLIEKIWALNLDFQNLIRLPYLSKMKRFFLKNNPNKNIKVLEIGCGSGWVCRLVADEQFQIIGTDFSEKQLTIAREQAKLFGKDNFCKYELADAASFQKDIDGVVIHALLHHLSKNELMTFFEQIKKLDSGTKVYLYEPVFISPKNISPSLKDKILNKLIVKLKNYSINKAKIEGQADITLKNAIDRLYEQAEKNGWYISPKEVPFYQDELYGYLKPHFQIEKEYIVNRTDLEIAQSLILNQTEKPSFMFSKVLIPLSIWLDTQALKGNFSKYIQPLQHQFLCLEMIKK